MNKVNLRNISTAMAAVFVLAFVAIVLPGEALAQRGGWGDGRPGRNDEGRNYGRSDVRRVVDRVEARSDAFRALVDKSLDRGYLNNTRREDRINDRVSDYNQAIGRFRKAFGGYDRRDAGRVEFRDVLQKAQVVDRLIYRVVADRALPRRAVDDWGVIRNDLNWLADNFNVPGMGSVPRWNSRMDVRRVVDRVENRSDAFKALVDKSLDRSYLDNTRQEDRINDRVSDYNKAIGRFRKEFNQRERWDAGRNEFRDVLQQARQVDRLIDRAVDSRALPRRAGADWRAIREDLNWLANSFDLPGLGNMPIYPAPRPGPGSGRGNFPRRGGY